MSTKSKVKLWVIVNYKNLWKCEEWFDSCFLYLTWKFGFELLLRAIILVVIPSSGLRGLESRTGHFWSVYGTCSLLWLWTWSRSRNFNTTAAEGQKYGEEFLTDASSLGLRWNIFESCKICTYRNCIRVKRYMGHQNITNSKKNHMSQNSVIANRLLYTWSQWNETPWVCRNATDYGFLFRFTVFQWNTMINKVN